MRLGRWESLGAPAPGKLPSLSALQFCCLVVPAAKAIKQAEKEVGTGKKRRKNKDSVDRPKRKLTGGQIPNLQEPALAIVVLCCCCPCVRHLLLLVRELLLRRRPCLL
jgi:hypothetical protein